ncbi:LytR/AlgR family response regulator transcription factor [Jiulongibacter sp. NS-SX5]|uniref:LytR/AlgR family response regulator transcription factor n=1 Tax=Jiulongibacter sp. NS-SX5 TaxID=3463854 RepID=UPI004059FA71
MNPESNKTLRFLAGNQEFQVNEEEIIRLEGKKNYTFVYTENQAFLSSKTLKTYEMQLSSSEFIRTHKSHLINKSFVRKTYFYAGTGTVELQNGDKVDVSRRRVSEVKKLLSPHRLKI